MSNSIFFSINGATVVESSGSGPLRFSFASRDEQQTVRGGPGDQTLSGGPGADTFVFGGIAAEGEQHDTITDFTPGEDKIDFDGVSRRTVSTYEEDGGLVVDYGRLGGGGSTIFLEGVSQDEVRPSDFIF